MLAIPSYIYCNKNENSLVFMGDADATIPIIPSATGFNFAYWIYIYSITQEHGLFNWESTFDRNGINFRLNNTNDVIATVGSNAAATVFVLTSTTSLLPNRWYHLAHTYNSGGQVRVYLNGVLNLSGSGTITSNANLARISRRAFTTSQRGKYMIKDFFYQVTTTAWTQSQITEMYLRRAIPTGALFYKFNNTVTDQYGLNPLVLFNAHFTSNVPSQMT